MSDTVVEAIKEVLGDALKQAKRYVASERETDRWWQAFCAFATVPFLDNDEGGKTVTYTRHVPELCDAADTAISEAKKRGRL